jgi:outer membrane protein OmpA-like peptidoglycan-associated protein
MGNGKVRAGGLSKKSWRTATAVIGLLALGGCSSLNPIDWFRDTKNDPGADAPNSANLEAGSDQPYPNLSSVPSTPTRGLTQAERDALAKGLVSDRQNAHYADVQQRAGNAGAVPGPQAKIPEEQLVPIDLNNIQQPAQTPASGEQHPAQQAPLPVSRPLPMPAPAPLPRAPQAPRVTSVAPVAASGSSHLSVGGGLAAPVAASRESALKTPTPREEPQAETPTEPPASPTLPPVPPAQPVQPMVQGHAAPNSSSLSVGGVPLPPAEPVRTEATPEVPAIPSAPVTQPAAAVPVPGKRQNSVPAGQIQFTAGSSVLPADIATSLKAVPAQLQAHAGAIVRVVGHATIAATGADAAGQQLAAYQAALARAAAVKQALVAEGVDATKIQTEAAAGTGDRADLLIEY